MNLSPQVGVSALDDGGVIVASEANRTIFGVVDDFPDTCFRFDAGLVAVGIEERAVLRESGRPSVS